MDIKNIIKNNIKFIILMIIIIALGVIGMAYAITIGNFNRTGINTTSAALSVTVSYGSETEGNITSAGTLLPISDSLVTLDTEDARVLKINFNVTGASSNPENTIYDISLRNIDMDCELKTSDFKWELYNEEQKLNEGSFSPTFDEMLNNRLVLTKTQEELTTNTNTYTLLIWISENCTEDITSCDVSLSQEKYINKTFKASIKVELSTGNKKKNERTTRDIEGCEYIETTIPTCNSDLIYNGTRQALVNSGINYTLTNQIGTNAGYYTVTVQPNDGYKWDDGTTNKKVMNCEIKKKEVTITTIDQTITFGEEISSTPDKVNISGLILGHTLNSITLYPSIINVGTGTISASNAKILDASNFSVTDNYDFTYNDTGIITINDVS